MKNGDKPIYPAFSVTAQSGNENLATPEAANRGMINHANIGLSKREYFAGLAMQAILNNESGYFQSAQRVAEMAVEQADELLNYLEEKEEK